MTRKTSLLTIALTLFSISFLSCQSQKTNSPNQTNVQVKELSAFDNYVKNQDLLLGMPVRLKYDDNDQHLFVQDLPNWAIIEIDDSSNVVNTYGRKGRGPGEIEMLNDFYFNKDHLFIVEGSRFFIHKYSRKDGKHVSSLDFAEVRRGNHKDGAQPPRPIPLNDNNNQPFVTLNETVLIPSQFGKEYLYEAVDWEGQKVADIGKMPGNCTISKSEEEVRSALENKKVPAKDQCFAFPVSDRANPDEIFIIYSAIPKIEKYNLTGQKLWERKIPIIPEVDSLTIDLSILAKEHPDRRLGGMKVRKYIAGRSNVNGELFLITYTNLVTRFAPRRSIWIHKFDKEGNLAERMKIVSEEDLNPYVGMDFEGKRILANPNMQVDIRTYKF